MGEHQTPFTHEIVCEGQTLVMYDLNSDLNWSFTQTLLYAQSGHAEILITPKLLRKKIFELNNEIRHLQNVVRRRTITEEERLHAAEELRWMRFCRNLITKRRISMWSDRYEQRLAQLNETA